MSARLAVVGGVIVTPEEAGALQEFMDQHDGTEYAQHGGTCLAWVPYGSGGVTVGRESWPAVLGALGEFFPAGTEGGPPPRRELPAGNRLRGGA